MNTFGPLSSRLYGLPVPASAMVVQKGHPTQNPPKGGERNIMSETTETTAFAASTSEEYIAMDKGAKATYRSNVAKAVKAAIGAKDIETAFSLQNHLDAVVAASKADTSDNKATPVEIVIKRVAMLRAAAKRLEAGMDVPNGLIGDVNALTTFRDELAAAVESGQTHTGWTEADEKAIKDIAAQKVTRSPKVGNVLNHVNQVIADNGWESGTFHKVSELSVKSDQYPVAPSGGYSALNGRIAAMLTAMVAGDRVEEDAAFDAVDTFDDKKALGVVVA